MASRILTQARLSELLDYDPDTGVFVWKVSMRGVAKGAVAGCLEKNRYIRISVDKTLYHAHRLAWFYVNGEWPSDVVDHINGNKSDNRIDNLQAVSQKVNVRKHKLFNTNTSGVSGVSLSKGKWRARDYAGKSLGYFENFDDAVAARRASEVAA
jgi:hypothetical protein